MIFRILPLLLFSACAATSGESVSATGSPARVTFAELRNGVTMTLVNESHSDPLSLYSEVRDRPGPKVTSDEVMEAMLDHFHDQGWGRFAASGAAVAITPETYQSLEVESDGRRTHLLNGPRATPDARATFRSCLIAFLQVQELTQQNQAVSNSRGTGIFRDPKAELGGSR
ncbi:MAG: hypothetical protein CMJ84_09960 [Planctomycetes bacterium]|nr:hypothetical protein [Planctomycetota bacterium]MDP6408700.1 hypothetical protein [Planctomycetota bacterium]